MALCSFAFLKKLYFLDSCCTLMVECTYCKLLWIKASAEGNVMVWHSVHKQKNHHCIQQVHYITLYIYLVSISTPTEHGNHKWKEVIEDSREQLQRQTTTWVEVFNETSSIVYFQSSNSARAAWAHAVANRQRRVRKLCRSLPEAPSSSERGRAPLCGPGEPTRSRTACYSTHPCPPHEMPTQLLPPKCLSVICLMNFSKLLSGMFERRETLWRPQPPWQWAKANWNNRDHERGTRNRPAIKTKMITWQTRKQESFDLGCLKFKINYFQPLVPLIVPVAV